MDAEPPKLPQPTHASLDRPRIGMLWGDFPWSSPPGRVGKLFSMGAVARNITRALNQIGAVVPYVAPPPQAAPDAQGTALRTFLTSIDILWADLYPASAPALELRRQLGLACPAVLFAGGAMPKGAEAMLLPWQHLLTPHDQLVFTCEADRAIWHTLVRWNAMHEWVIPLGVDDTVFYPRSPEERAAARTRHHLPDTAPLLFYVGRFNIQKNLHTLLHLLRAVCNVIPNAHLCLVAEEDDIVLGEFGVGNTGYVTWLRQVASELDIADNITFVGPQFGDELARLYATADVLVNASIYHRENFGLAQAEAQACGLPVVCTAWGGFKDVVLEGETGYFMDAVMTKRGVRVDWATGAHRVIQLLTDPPLHAQLRARAHAWAQQRFSSTALAHALAPIVATRPERAGYVDDAALAYEPSSFARRYEAHKRRCGWYASTTQRRRRWYPPMFQGRDYALYETLLGPYATYRAATTPAYAIGGTWIPYIVSPLRLDAVCRLVEDRDPIWPQRRFLEPLEWDILQLVDGVTPVEQIVDVLCTQHGYNDRDVRTGLWHLYVEGIIMLQRV